MLNERGEATRKFNGGTPAFAYRFEKAHGKSVVRSPLACAMVTHAVKK